MTALGTEQPLPILYSFRRCPYAMRARMALMVSGTVCELREVLLRDKPAHMVQLSDKATVPVLQLVNGDVIDESIDVMHWALARTDPDAWLTADPALTSALIAHNDNNFKPELDRYKYHVNYPDHSQAFYRERATGFLLELDERLQAHGGLGLLDRRLTLADVAIFPFVRQFARVDWVWFSGSAFASLRAWLLAFESSELYQTIMKKYPVWVSGDRSTFFGQAYAHP